MTLDDKLKAVQESMTRPSEPLWKGPEVDGITQSLLSRWLVCRERFRILAIEGLRPRDDFNHRIEYGNMWHVCEEADALHQESNYWYASSEWMESLAAYCEKLCARYPLRQGDILKWVNVCAVAFPEYIKYWADHPDVLNGQNICKEKPFAVPYNLPSGRTVILRGKADSIDWLPAHRDGNREYLEGIWLQEDKTKGDVDPIAIKQQLRRDLQTMFYQVALPGLMQQMGVFAEGDGAVNWPILGVRYNVVRRPLSGGRHSISQHKATLKKHAETDDEFYARLASLIAGEPEYFFMRWKSAVESTAVEHFRRTCLDPILDQLCDWYSHVAWCKSNNSDPFRAGCVTGRFHHFTFPYGVYNPLTDGGTGDVDNLLETGSQAGLQRIDNLFPELT